MRGSVQWLQPHVKLIGKVRQTSARYATMDCEIYGRIITLRTSRAESLRADHYFVRAGRKTELCASFAIHFQGCGNVQRGNLNLAGPRAAAPIVRTGVDGGARDHILSYFFLVSVSKHQDGGRKLAGGLRSLNLARGREGGGGCQTGGLLGLGLEDLPRLRLTVVRKSHPVITLQLEDERLGRVGHGG